MKPFYLSDRDTPAIIISKKDNIAIAKRAIRKNSSVRLGSVSVKLRENVESGQRFALDDIRRNNLCFQYGYPFGVSNGLKKGEVLSPHKVRIYRESYRKIFRRPGSFRPDAGKTPDDSPRTFLGYKRADGKTGTRNHYLIMPASLCASDMATKIAGIAMGKDMLKDYKNIDGITAAAHTEGCGTSNGGMIERTLLTLKNTIEHPNVGGVLVVDLGCEKTTCGVISKYISEKKHCKTTIDYISIQAAGGTDNTISSSLATIIKRLDKVNRAARKKVSVDNLIIGTKCGGSDTFSGVTANPLIGMVIDKIVSLGGSAILSEVPEIMGAEKILVDRVCNLKTAKKFRDMLIRYRLIAKKLGVSVDDNLGNGNKAGGLLTMTLKSLGAVMKGGSAPVVDVLNYSERVKRKGLNIMDGPGNDLESMTGMVASGANVILFSTGCGSTEGNIIVPVIKISSTTNLYNNMRGDMDFNAGELLQDDLSFDRLAEKLLDLVIRAVSGEKTRAEVWNKRSFQIWTAGKLSL